MKPQLAIELLVLLCIFSTTLSLAVEPTHRDESEILFARRIGSLLREKCLGCHGQDPESIEGGIDFRSIDSMIAGGDSGQPGIVPGEPSQSPIYLAALRGEETFSAMPPKESEALTKEQLGWLHRWIETGASWPDQDRLEQIELQFAETWSVEDGVIMTTSGGLDANWTNRRYDPQGLWAYQPLSPTPTIPPDQNIVDHFIELKIPEGLSIAPRADRRTLIRRATFDLTGLPPSPEEVEAFLQDPAQDSVAIGSLIDRLLQSPHYGERMAQHWLDVTRYADSSGFANDFERGNAWRYRDYVIRSFNDDQSYDEFIRQQIAGDEISPDDPTAIVAAGFLRMGPWELTGMEVPKVARGRFLDDVTNSVGETFLGQSLQCCRCHDHKFDPIPTRDYYRVQAVFATTQLAERSAPFVDHESIDGFEEEKYLQESWEHHQQTLTLLDNVLLANANAWFAENDPDPALKQRWHETVEQLQNQAKVRGVFDAARSKLMSQGVPQQDLPPKYVGFTPNQFGIERVARKGLSRLSWELDRYKPFALSVYNGFTPDYKSVYEPVRIPKDRENGELEKPCIRTGGDPFAEGDAVTPGALSVIEDQVPAVIPNTLSGRRTALANWIADSNNPLTTRVIVNRIWQWHFGRAIAGNPNNFGSTGKRPTHPELLDALAHQLIANGWSIKSLHRSIMTSEAYCRSTDHPDPISLADIDPQFESYAVFLPRRISAEELRDSMLSISGELNPKIGGIPCRPIINMEVSLQPRQVMGTFASAWTPNPRPHDRNRRSIYVLKLRGLVDPSLEVFNSPSPDFSCERRDTSTITPQVFALFNSENTHSRSLALSKMVLEQSSTPEKAIQLIYDRMFARMATSTEISRCMEHLQKVKEMLPSESLPSPAMPLQIVREAIEENTGENFTFVEPLYAMKDFVPDLQPADVDHSIMAMADLCLVLFNSNEFIYVY